MKILRELPVSWSIPPGQLKFVAGGLAVLGVIVLVGAFAFSAGTISSPPLPEPAAPSGETALEKSHKATIVRRVKTLTFRPDGTLVNDGTGQ
ncbi:MAG: hypothetical protein KDJ16_01025 [Hyphomicrobiales bacterium]|nr:hypothetical protein [Hyphomicrobiales bacterium]